MNQMEGILSKYREFGEYLQTINLDELRQNNTRHELTEFKKQLYDIELRSVAYEVGKITDEMKKEEYPELLGVHHFPVLREIDFLTEEEKKKLDERLLLFRVGNYLGGLASLGVTTEKRMQIEKFLVDHEIVEEINFALCPSCMDEHISSGLTNEQKDELESLLNNPDMDERYEKLGKFIEDGCGECGRWIDLEEISHVPYKTALKMIKGRDTTLDNV